MSKRKKSYFFENLEVLDAGAKGKAIAKSPDGRVIFLSNAVPGDWVDVQTGRKRKSYFEGKAVHFHQRSPRRTDPKCAHFGLCGGCKWQNMKYEDQLYFKNKEVLNNLKRIGQVEAQQTDDILGSDQIYAYRNKMEFTFSASRWLTEQELQSKEVFENRNACGFHMPGMWDKILDIETCHLQEEPSNSLRNKIKSYALEKGLSFYDPRKKQGLLRTLMIRISSIGEIMVLIQFFEPDQDKIQDLLNYVMQTFPTLTSLQYVINTKGNDTLYDQEVILYHGRDHIFEEMEGLRFKINAKSFYQTNSKQAYKLYALAREMADLQGEETLYDLYTGTGTIALFMAKNAAKVVGVEAVEEAIQDAKYNAQANGIDHCHFFAGDMAKIFTDDFIEANGRPDVVITDPPRDGMHKKVVEQLLKIAPKKIVYISCNSATQARDLFLMKDQYDVVRSKAVDMFPQTHHVENVVLLKLREAQ